MNARAAAPAESRAKMPSAVEIPAWPLSPAFSVVTAVTFVKFIEMRSAPFDRFPTSVAETQGYLLFDIDGYQAGAHAALVVACTPALEAHLCPLSIGIARRL